MAKVRDLPAPVTCSKADWLPGTTYLGFTPQGKGPNARGQCEATIVRQFGSGFVLERVTKSFERPNAGYENDQRVAEDRQRHTELADRLIAIHQLRHSSRPLHEIVGEEEYNYLQNVWANNDRRDRWSVAFPIVRTFEVVGQPKARDVFDGATFARLYQSQHAGLRPFDDEARSAIADLELVEKPAPSAWIAIADEVVMAERSAPAERRLVRAIDRDLGGALEGQTEERQAKVRARAYWLAERFVRERRRAGTMQCDDCGFDPAIFPRTKDLPARSCLDVHHKDPLTEGTRYTTTDDFALLCPTCHRIEHLRMRARAGA